MEKDSQRKDVNIMFHNSFQKRIIKNLTGVEYDLLMCVIVELHDRKDEDIIIPLHKLEAYIRTKNQRRNRTISQIMSLWKKIRNIDYYSVTPKELNTKESYIPLFSNFEIGENKDTLKLSLNSKLIYLFSDLTGNYTTLKESEFLKTKNIYGKRLFLLLAQWRSTGFKRAKAHDLREALDCPDSYDTNKFHNRVLFPAIESVREFFPGLVMKKEISKRVIIEYKFSFDKRRKAIIDPSSDIPEEEESKRTGRRNKTSREFMSLLKRINIEDLVNEDYFERHTDAVTQIEKSYIDKVVNHPDNRLWNDMTFLGTLIYNIKRERNIAPWHLEASHLELSKNTQLILPSSVYEALSQDESERLYRFISKEDPRECDNYSLI